MRFSVFLGVISVVFASSTYAATLVATTDQAIYQEGDLVTIKLTGTTVGAGPGKSRSVGHDGCDSASRPKH